ncbi:MAG: ribonuclease III [Candidatus Zixiibacteriota bacterium]
MKLSDFLRRLGLDSSARKEVDELSEKFYKKFGYKFKKAELLFEALTHRSYLYYNEGVSVSSERLEYLGDSVLGIVTAEHLFKSYPEYNEGDLTKTKALLVNETTLAMVGEDCGLNMFILMSPEEEKSGGRNRNSIISDAVEAVIGAIFLDSGLRSARKFIRENILSHSKEIFNDTNQYNYKGELLEFMQHRGQQPPYYEVVSEEGPDHKKTFYVVVKTNGKVAGTGNGQSKKEAEQKAAAEALEKLKAFDSDEYSI